MQISWLLWILLAIPAAGAAGAAVMPSPRAVLRWACGVVLATAGVAGVVVLQVIQLGNGLLYPFIRGPHEVCTSDHSIHLFFARQFLCMP